MKSNFELIPVDYLELFFNYSDHFYIFSGQEKWHCLKVWTRNSPGMTDTILRVPIKKPHPSFKHRIFRLQGKHASDKPLYLLDDDRRKHSIMKKELNNCVLVSKAWRTRENARRKSNRKILCLTEENTFPLALHPFFHHSFFRSMRRTNQRIKEEMKSETTKGIQQWWIEQKFFSLKKES